MSQPFMNHDVYGHSSLIWHDYVRWQTLMDRRVDVIHLLRGVFIGNRIIPTISLLDMILKLDLSELMTFW